MDIQLIPATVASVPEMIDCGRRAFENDALEHAIFPNRSEALLDSKESKEYRMNRIRKRLQSPDWHYVLATIDSTEAPVKVVGYAGWMAPPPQENDTEQKRWDGAVQSQTEHQPFAIEDEYCPEGMDMDAFKHGNEVIEKAKKEILGKEEHRVWYLASLAVDPDFKGKGIASKLVKWGISKAEEVGLPAYLESSPAAVGLYRRLGFKELRKLSLIRNNESHVQTVMMRTPGSAEA